MLDFSTAGQALGSHVLITRLNRSVMNKKIWLAAGITGMLLGNSPANAVELCMSPGPRDRVSFVISSQPNFVNLPDQGFSVSIGSPYDIITYDNWYYINQNGYWYRASDYRGPWGRVNDNGIPERIRRYRMEDIRRYRDTEYRRNESRTNLEQQRRDENNRRNLEQQRGDENNRRNLEQQRSDENNRRKLEQQRGDEINRRNLEQQRRDDYNRR